ncbi:MAG: GDP-L-fucose synthase [Armatimonadetes bacterium]|nr:GDP-L-fucose synthase [Armatimonadota bacterium]
MKRLLLTGASGFLGHHLKPLLEANYEVIAPSRDEADLRDMRQVTELLQRYRPERVVNLAALVGGILVNRQRPAEFFYDNLMIGANVMHAAWEAGVEKYLTVIGGCSYPATATSPIGEDQLWQGYPQPDSAPYSIAKMMSLEQARAYRRQYGFNAVCLIPGNMYGPHDNYNLNDAHVIPALIRKIHAAREAGESRYEAWGSGRAVRDFVYVGDVARCLAHALEVYDDPEPVNISSGEPTTIRELVTIIAELLGYEGEVVWDTGKPEGQIEKVFDVTRMREVLGFECETSLRDGLARTIAWYEANYPDGIRL